MKIIIIGGGISGLATYLYLRKHLPAPPSGGPAHIIHIYESHKPRANNTRIPTDAAHSFETLSTSTAIVGGGLGVSPNGMRVLRDLDPAIHAAVAAQGFPCEHFIFMGQNGWRLGMVKTSDEGSVKLEGGESEVCVSSTRHGLWACLMGAVPAGVVRYRKLSGVREGDGGRWRVVFEDGGEEECDLLIGADGVKSTVRQALFGDSAGELSPVYTGASGIGGVMNAPLPPRVADNKAMVFTFGRTGFFGYASASPASANALLWWSTFETDSLPSKTDLNLDEIKASMRERHGDWADPVIRDIVSKAEVDSIYPTWVLPDLPHWGEKGIVLVGDAAHALSPTTGQGASQALEDAQTLSLLLAEMLRRAYGNDSSGGDGGLDDGLRVGKERDAVAQTLKMFYEIRQPRVAKIAERGRKLDRGKRKMSVVEEYSMYCFLWLLNHVPSIGKMLIGDVNAELYGWSVRDEIKKAMAKLDAVGVQ